MSVWPAPKTVAACLRGSVREVLSTPDGPALGLSSGIPHVKLIVSWLPGRAGAACFNCGVFEVAPDPPASMEAGATRTALLAPGTPSHAIFALAWLHRFAKAHAECHTAPPGTP